MTTTPEPLENKVNQLETALGRLAELSFNNAQRHDNAITQLLEVTSRNSEAINRLEANSNKHDQAIAQLLEVTNRNSESINRMENAITNLTTTVANNNTRLTDRLDAIAERSDAERETFIAEIREIWRYLRYQPGNGRSGNNDA